MSTPHVPWAGWWSYTGRCSCGAEVTAASFRDSLSWRDFQITNLCQLCQDLLYFSCLESDSSQRFPLRRGVLAAPIQRESGLELGLLPFIFVAPEARVAWEPRFLLRAGALLEPLDPWAELSLMRPALEDHQVRLTEVADLRAPEVRTALDVDLIVLMDEVAALSLGRVPVETEALHVVLDRDLPWEALYGAPLPSLLDSWAGGIEGSSVLRTCALLGLALEPMGAGSFFGLGYLLAPHQDRFPELVSNVPDDSL